MRSELDRTTPIGQMINNYLQSKSDLEDHVIHLLFSANRWELAYEIYLDPFTDVTDWSGNLLRRR